MQTNGSQSFSAPYDKLTVGVTLVVIALGVVLVFITKMPLVAALSALLLIGAYAWSPRGFTVDDDAIFVRRLIGSVRIPLAGVREARPATSEDFRGALRLWGNGGLFGYYGFFRTWKLGRCKWYVTDRGRGVVVVTAARTYVLSPGDVEGFLGAVHEAVPASQAAPDALMDATKLTESSNWLSKNVGWVIGLAVLAVVAAAFLYSPGPPTYTLTPDSLVIHDRFYPVRVKSADVDVEHVRVVDLSTDTSWRPTVRTNGFSNFHYHSGWYRTGNGKQVRMYRADSTRLVLLPPKGESAPVLIEVAQPDEFVRQLQAQWVRK